MRPEAVGFEQQGSRIRVHGEAGPDDVVLIRVNALEWTSDAATQVDPLGFVVFDPGAAGAFETTLAFHKTKPAAPTLDDADYPRILPEGVVEATAYGRRLRTGSRTSPSSASVFAPMSPKSSSTA
ncbi:MAG: hypothetical protein R2748_25235 [Bryobacterales bacterium]